MSNLGHSKPMKAHKDNIIQSCRNSYKLPPALPKIPPAIIKVDFPYSSPKVNPSLPYDDMSSSSDGEENDENSVPLLNILPAKLGETSLCRYLTSGDESSYEGMEFSSEDCADVDCSYDNSYLMYSDAEIEIITGNEDSFEIID
jgi:hypothetical protein